MSIMRLNYLWLLLLILTVSCDDDDGPRLAPFDERVTEAVSNLRSELMAPNEGWKLEYQPTPDAGVFLMLLDFDDTEVTIRSDVPDDDGVYFEQTIPYRIDNALGLELILETFGVFHFLFEQDQASFGAEFEFIFQEKSGSNLLFESKTDFFSPTQLIFEPAASGDANAFARDIAENLNAFSGFSPQSFFPQAPQQQLVLNDLGISVFWSMDVQKRNITAQIAGEGLTVDEVLTNGGVLLDHTTGYALRNGNLVLLDPLLFVLGGQQVTISSIALNAFDMSGASICSTAAVSGPRYSGSAGVFGDVTLLSSLLSTDGLGFTLNVYSINIDFVFDGAGNPLSQGGIVGQRFPDATGFVLFYGVPLVDPEIPIWSAGLILADGNIYVREFEATATEINRIKIDFTNNYYHSGTPAAGDQANLQAVLNEIFSGDEMYAFSIPLSGVSLFRLFNPCNNYDVLLVQ